VEGYERDTEVPGPDEDTLPELAVSAETAAGNALHRLSCCVRYGEGMTVQDPEREALELIRRAARLENADAMTALADWYAQESERQEREANEACAEGWYRRAMEKGQPDAGYRLACLLMARSERTDDPTPLSEAAELLKIWAERGHAEAMYALAECYFEGRGVSKDPAEGFDYLLRAADAPVGMVRAKVLVGDCYRMGWGVSPDPEKAAEYTLSAAQSRLWEDRYPWMGQKCPRWYAHKVQREDAQARTEARFRLSVYGLGSNESTVSLVDERFVYLCEAVMEGHTAAREHLACIVAGRSTPARYFPWLHLAPKPMDLTLYRGPLQNLSPLPAAAMWTVTGEVTEAMCASALNYVGDGFYEGRCGLPQKQEAAVQCYREAAAVSGQYWAQYSLGFCLLYGVGTAADADEAVAYLTRAATGHAGACRLLGMCYETGEGVDAPNLRIALKYYRKALKLGDAEAASKVKETEKKLRKRTGGKAL
jgi:TPR repeat protein